MGSSGSSSKYENLKKLLFFFSQKNDLSNKIDKEIDLNFYIVNETIKRYQSIFNEEKLLNDWTMSNLKKKLEGNEFEKIKKYSDLEKEKEITKCIPSDLKLNSSNNIQFPIEFFLIEENNISLFNDICRDKKNKFKNNLFKGHIINRYILIEWTYNKNDLKYFAISLNENEFNVDFIFFTNNQDISNEELLNKVYDFLKNKKDGEYLDESNNKINLNDLEVICYPAKEGIKEKEKKYQYKIKKYFDINKIYKKFILSIDKITNMNSFNDVQKEIDSSDENYNVFLINEKQFDKILERLYFNEYLISSQEKEKQDKNNIQKVI